MLSDGGAVFVFHLGARPYGQLIAVSFDAQSVLLEWRSPPCCAPSSSDSHGSSEWILAVLGATSKALTSPDVSVHNKGRAPSAQDKG
jgi:hypothetical protein